MKTIDHIMLAEDRYTTNRWATERDIHEREQEKFHDWSSIEQRHIRFIPHPQSNENP